MFHPKTNRHRRRVVLGLLAIGLVGGLVVAPQSAGANPRTSVAAEYRRIVVSLIASYVPERQKTTCYNDDYETAGSTGYCIARYSPGTYPFSSADAYIKWQPDLGSEPLGPRLIELRSGSVPDAYIFGVVAGPTDKTFRLRSLRAPWGTLAPGGDRPGVPAGSPGGPLQWYVSRGSSPFSGGYNFALVGYVYIEPTGQRALPPIFGS